MTHMLIFKIVASDMDDLRFLHDEFTGRSEFFELYCLMRRQSSPGLSYCTRGTPYKDGLVGAHQPFITFFSEDAEDAEFFEDGEKNFILIETGSHVSVEDTLEALHWYHFCLAFVVEFAGTIGGWDYRMFRSGTDEDLSFEEMHDRIAECSTELVRSR